MKKRSKYLIKYKDETIEVEVLEISENNNYKLKDINGGRMFWTDEKEFIIIEELKKDKRLLLG